MQNRDVERADELGAQEIAKHQMSDQIVQLDSHVIGNHVLPYLDMGDLFKMQGVSREFRDMIQPGSSECLVDYMEKCNFDLTLEGNKDVETLKDLAVKMKEGEKDAQKQENNEEGKEMIVDKKAYVTGQSLEDDYEDDADHDAKVNSD